MSPEGDVDDPQTGMSPYPGNINQLILSVGKYYEQLEATKGHVPEFVNPKYQDATKTSFKSPTRLECMMQDYPRTIPATHKVGFTLLEVWVAYSPVKNSPAEAMAKAAAGNPSHSATTGELDIYRANCNVLRHLGAKIEDPEEQTFNGIEVEVRTEPLNRNRFFPRVLTAGSHPILLPRCTHGSCGALPSRARSKRCRRRWTARTSGCPRGQPSSWRGRESRSAGSRCEVRW